MTSEPPSPPWGHRSWWARARTWARPGHASRHNLGYWEGGSWEAAGPGAHAFDGVTRRWNAARLDGYVAALLPTDGAPPQLPPGGQDSIAADARATEAEAAILALRMRTGIPASALDRPSLGPALAWALDTRLLERTAEHRLALTLSGRLLSNELFVRLV